MRDEGVVPGYGQYGVLTRAELERFFHLDEQDRELIAERRRDSNRLGFAVQLVTVRYWTRWRCRCSEVVSDIQQDRRRRHHREVRRA
ncbi:DUF4158 domain-containing protein [Nocardia sp. NBC_00881]|nr:DUF4158 domain-containing protein [Nocardia sp. NBC_00881]